MTRKWLSYVPVTLAVTLALALAVIDAQSHPSSVVFSEESLEQFSLLNHEFGMAVSDLSESNNSPLMSQFVQANALLPAERADKSALGLLASLKGGESVLLLQPTTALSQEILAEAAQTYTSTIPEFVHVEIDQPVELLSPVFEWKLQGVLPELPKIELSSEELSPVKVALIDSGVDKTHEIFVDTPIKSGWNTISDDTDTVDDVGHGTHVAGIIAEYAPGVGIVPYKIVDANGGKLSNVLEAFSKALDEDVDIINTSFGVPSPSYALENMVNMAYAKGIIVTSAAGNAGADTGFYPAHYAQTIAVGSVDSASHQLASSNYGVWVDVAAYGYNVRSSLPNNKYGYKSGTSQATAFVTAAVARLLQGSPGLSFEEILRALESSQERVPDGTLAGTPIVQ